MSVKERLEIFIRFNKISKSEFCRRIGVSNAFISSMRKSIQPDKIQSIALSFPALSLEWLMNGTGEMLNGAVSLIKKPPDEPPEEMSNQAIMTRLVLSNEKLVLQNGELIKILADQTAIIKDNSNTINNLSYQRGEEPSKNVAGGTY